MIKVKTTSVKKFSSSDLFGRLIISARDGVQLGVVKDLMIDLNLLEVAAIVTDKGDLVKRDLSLIPAGEVVLWGQDIILVTHVDVIKARAEMPECEKWVSVSEDLVDQRIMTTAGEDLGVIKDLIIAENGRIEGYVSNKADQMPEMLKQFDDEQVYIPVIGTHSLGADMLIINPAKLTGISQSYD